MRLLVLEINAVKQYGPEDIQILGDPVAVIRRRPEMYAGPKPIAPGLASLLMRDLIWLDALPARIERNMNWWFVRAGRDWLVTNEGSVSMTPFFRIVNFPEVGQFGFRTEILLNAFAKAVVTCGSDGITWISGDIESSPLPHSSDLELSDNGLGRVLAFKIEE